MGVNSNGKEKRLKNFLKKELTKESSCCIIVLVA